MSHRSLPMTQGTCWTPTCLFLNTTRLSLRCSPFLMIQMTHCKTRHLNSAPEMALSSADMTLWWHAASVWEMPPGYPSKVTPQLLRTLKQVALKFSNVTSSIFSGKISLHYISTYQWPVYSVFIQASFFYSIY